MRLKRMLVSTVLAMCLVAGCLEDDPLDSSDTPETSESAAAVCTGASTLRVVSANMAHLEAEGHTDKYFKGVPGIQQPLPYWLRAQSHALKRLALPGQANAFALQEVDEVTDRTLGRDWPREFTNGINGSPGDVCSDYTHDSDPWFRWGRLGNATITNVSARDSASKWLLGAHCSASDVRTAVVKHLRHGTTDVYVVNVHLSFCWNGEYGLNSCELNTIFGRIDSELPADAVVVIAGDFNIRSRGNAGATCTQGEASVQYDRLLSRMHAAGFAQVPVRETNGTRANIVDHIFLRDTAYRTRGVRGQFARSDVSVQGNVLPLSDHRWILADIVLEGPGMSPAFVPIMAAL